MLDVERGEISGLMSEDWGRLFCEFWATGFKRHNCKATVAVAIWPVNGQGFQNTKMTGNPLFSVNFTKWKDSS